MRKRNYKTIRGLMRQKFHGFLSVADVISGDYYHKHGWYQPFTLTDEALRKFPDGIIDDCETKADLDFVIGDIPRQALRAVEEGEELYGCDVNKYVSDIDDECVTKLMIDTLSEYLGLTA